MGIHMNGFSSDLDRAITSTEDIKKVIKENKGYATADFNIRNIDRSTCAMLSGDIAHAHGNTGFKGRINLNIFGSAGQSFGAFILPGLSVRLEGEANDYVAKGMTGGVVVVLGSVGRNVGAGMTGGIGYFYDEDDSFDVR